MTTTATTWKNDQATAAQLGFIESLRKQREVPELDEIPEFILITKGVTITKGEASALITMLKAAPYKAVEHKPAAKVQDEDDSKPAEIKGYFTVQDDEGHRTFRISPNQKWCSGKTVISVLTGPSNTSSYTGIGFVSEDGVKLWKKFSTDSRMASMVEALMDDMVGAHQLTLWMAKQNVLESTNCFVCGLLLTDPLSIELGIGPVCRESSF